MLRYTSPGPMPPYPFQHVPVPPIGVGYRVHVEKPYLRYTLGTGGYTLVHLAQEKKNVRQNQRGFRLDRGGGCTTPGQEAPENKLMVPLYHYGLYLRLELVLCKVLSPLDAVGRVLPNAYYRT